MSYFPPELLEKSITERLAYFEAFTEKLGLKPPLIGGLLFFSLISML